MPDSLREKSLAGIVNLPHDPAQPTAQRMRAAIHFVDWAGSLGEA
jgi:hypothetical protein